MARLDTLVTVVDANSFLSEYQAAEDLSERGVASDAGDDRTVTDLLIEQVEFSDVILLNKIDLTPPGEVERLERILHSLNPGAKILHSPFGRVSLQEVLNTGRFDAEAASRAPGWLRELRGEPLPESEEFGISSFVYTARTPRHPERFWELPHCRLDGVLRA